jgi:hypothetical protein
MYNKYNSLRLVAQHFFSLIQDDSSEDIISAVIQHQVQRKELMQNMTVFNVMLV